VCRGGPNPTDATGSVPELLRPPGLWHGMHRLPVPSLSPVRAGWGMC